MQRKTAPAGTSHDVEMTDKQDKPATSSEEHAFRHLPANTDAKQKGAWEKEQEEEEGSGSIPRSQR